MRKTTHYVLCTNDGSTNVRREIDERDSMHAATEYYRTVIEPIARVGHRYWLERVTTTHDIVREFPQPNAIGS